MAATIAVAFALMACTDQPTGPPESADLPEITVQADAASNEWIEFVDALLFNVCTGENMILNGRIHVVFKVTFPASGGLLIKGHANFAPLSGVGEDTGLNYHLVGSSSRGFGGLLFTPGGALVDHVVINQKWVAQGSASDRVFDANGFHSTFNANGELVSAHFFNDPGGECT